MGLSAVGTAGPGSRGVARAARSRALVVAVLACLCCQLQGFAPAVQPLFGALKTSGRSVSAHRLGICAKARAGRTGGALALRASDEKSGAESGAETAEVVLEVQDRWVLQLDEQTGRPYYWNRKTSEVTWYDPNNKGKSPVQKAVAGRSAAIDARARMKAQTLALGADPERDAQAARQEQLRAAAKKRMKSLQQELLSKDVAEASGDFANTLAPSKALLADATRSPPKLLQDGTVIPPAPKGTEDPLNAFLRLLDRDTQATPQVEQEALRAYMDQWLLKSVDIDSASGDWQRLFGINQEWKVPVRGDPRDFSKRVRLADNPAVVVELAIGDALQRGQVALGKVLEEGVASLRSQAQSATVQAARVRAQQATEQDTAPAPAKDDQPGFFSSLFSWGKSAPVADRPASEKKTSLGTDGPASGMDKPGSPEARGAPAVEAFSGESGAAVKSGLSEEESQEDSEDDKERAEQAADRAKQFAAAELKASVAAAEIQAAADAAAAEARAAADEAKRLQEEKKKEEGLLKAKLEEDLLKAKAEEDLRQAKLAEEERQAEQSAQIEQSRIESEEAEAKFAAQLVKMEAEAAAEVAKMEAEFAAAERLLMEAEDEAERAKTEAEALATAEAARAATEAAAAQAQAAAQAAMVDAKTEAARLVEEKEIALAATTAFEYSIAGESGGKAKENQDSTLIARISRDLSIYAVLDGHGQAGATVSQFCTEFLRDKLSTILPAAVLETGWGAKGLDRLMVTTFLETDTALQSALKGFSELQFDGSTCCVVVRHKRQLTIAALGDSRAVLGKINGQVQVLTEDHSPVRKSERKRIEKAGGRVDAFPDEPSIEESGKGRVFVGGEMYPGLAVARAFGDFVAKTVGVTAEPEMSSVTLKKQDSVLIIASDGLWDVLEPLKAVEIARVHAQARDAVLASADLVEIARSRWEEQKQEFLSLGGDARDWSIDDISAVTVFL